MTTPSLLQRLKERKLVQWALAYLAGAWVVLQALDPVSQAWGITPQTQRAIQILLLFGLVVTLILAWYHGEKGRQRVSGPELLMVAAVLAMAGVALSILGDGGNRLPRPSSRDGDERPGIAVLPCENMSADPSDAYLAPALHDEILLRLQGISSLYTIGRASVEWYQDHPAPLHQVAQDLGVAFVGQCSVQKHSNQIRLTFHLLDGETGAQAWAEEFSRTLTPSNLFDILRQIAQQVAVGLRVGIAPEEEARITSVPTERLEAYELYLKGLTRSRMFWSVDQESRESLAAEALALLREAARLDPNFGLPFAEIARLHLNLFWNWLDPTEARVELAREAMDDAFRLSPDRGESYLASGTFHYYVDRDYERAIEAYRQARWRMPGHPDPLRGIGGVLRRQGKFLEAARILEEAFLLDPLNAGGALAIGQAYGAVRQYQSALPWFERAAALGLGRGIEEGVSTYLALGDTAAARRYLSQASDSTAPAIILAGFGLEAYVRDFGSAAAWLERSARPLLDSPTGPIPAVLLSAHLDRWAGRRAEAQRKYGDALTVIEIMERQSKEFPVAHAAMGDRTAALAGIDSILLERRENPDAFARPVPFKEMAIVRVLLGDHDAAVDILEELLVNDYAGALSIAHLRLDPEWDPVRDNPRFQALLEKYAGEVQH